ncbi:Tetratricopeptide repeat-containing protein [Clostridium sp. DSM 8431]|uniref:tetratricopeptide repeat protein n=1 Tax=Clostridium sp. DSM 8431 TaxID=1761781 RepID=UPI0008F227B3|nr:hypothetical protein [Clostridium sp. DSM 8431]SFU30156.1 Tetratricopeptide repeat-containing protein [Clostridium sp. DSM 8431]
MGIFKLPGNLKVKKIILLILVLISICVIAKFAYDNKKIEVKEETKTEYSITNTDNIENGEELDIKTEPSEEDTLYDDVYNTFFGGDCEGAVNKGDLLISKYPDSYRGYSIRGIAKAFAGDFDKGMEDINKALEINPDYGYGRYNKALNYELYGYYDDALSWYDKALEIEDYMWSHYGKASIYGRRGDVSNAVLYLNKAVEAEKVYNGESAIKREAKTEKDFDPVRGKTEFENFINN